MKFRAERGEFADAVLWSLRTVGDRVSLPALSGVRLEVAEDRLSLVSSDLQLTSETSIPVHAERDGTALVPGKLFGDIIRQLPPRTVEAEVDGDRLRIACGSASFVLRLLPLEDYPPPPEPASDAASLTLPASTFARLIGQVARAASVDNPRAALTGVQLTAGDGVLKAAATDSYRLAVGSMPWPHDSTVDALVPRRALEEARRTAEGGGDEVALTFETGQFTVTTADRRLTTTLIDDTFPAYQALLPAGMQRLLVVNREELAEVVRRAAVVGDANTVQTPVTLELSDGTVRVTAGSGEVGEADESLPGVLDGEDLTISFNPRYLGDGLESVRSNEVRLEFNDSTTPAVLRPVDEVDGDGTAGVADQADQGEFLYLLMPIRL